MGKYKTFSKEEIKKIENEYLENSIKKLSKELGVSFGRLKRYLDRNGLIIPKDVLEQRKKANLLKKGHTPHNKGKKQSEFMSPESIEKNKATRFKKGNTPHNTNYDGHERVTKDGYVEVRIRKGVYRLKHIVEWEKINGKLPKGHCLKCQDGNMENTDPSNWNLISREENMLNNSFMNYQKEIIPSLALKSKINKKIKTLENGK